MNAFLALHGVVTDDESHAQDKAILLAEAGLDFMQLKLSSGESLWPYIISK